MGIFGKRETYGEKISSAMDALQQADEENGMAAASEAINQKVKDVLTRSNHKIEDFLDRAKSSDS